MKLLLDESAIRELMPEAHRLPPILANQIREAAKKKGATMPHYTPDDTSRYYVNAGIVTDESDIYNCNSCGFTVMPWSMYCDACGKNPHEKPNYNCLACGEKYDNQIAADSCGCYDFRCREWPECDFERADIREDTRDSGN